MSIKRRDKDDGYRGLLRNPETGRVFYANATTARRTDLERVLTADDEPTATASKAEDVTDDAPQDDAPAEDTGNDAAAALDELLAAANASEDKSELKVLGIQIGVKLTQNMNVETMKDRIQTQVAAIRAAG